MNSLRSVRLRCASIRSVYLHFVPIRFARLHPGGSHPFQEPRATGVSPLLGVGRTRRRDTLVPHVSSDRRDSSPGQKNDPFPAVSPETRHSGCDLFPISCLFGSVGTLGGLPAYERLPPFDPVSPGRARRPRRAGSILCCLPSTRITASANPHAVICKGAPGNRCPYLLCSHTTPRMVPRRSEPGR